MVEEVNQKPLFWVLEVLDAGTAFFFECSVGSLGTGGICGRGFEKVPSEYRSARFIVAKKKDARGCPSRNISFPVDPCSDRFGVIPLPVHNFRSILKGLDVQILFRLPGSRGFFLLFLPKGFHRVLRGRPDLRTFSLRSEARHQDGERLGRLLDRAERATPPGAVDVAKTVGTLQRRKDLDQRLFSLGVGGICGLGGGVGWGSGLLVDFVSDGMGFRESVCVQPEVGSVQRWRQTFARSILARTPRRLTSQFERSWWLSAAILVAVGQKNHLTQLVRLLVSAPGSLIARRLGPSRLFLGEHAVRSRCEAVPWCPWRITSGMMRREGDIGRCENIYSLI